MPLMWKRNHNFQMKPKNRKVATLAVTLITVGSLAGGANAAIVMGTNNGDGTWTAGGTTFSLVLRPFGGVVVSEVTTSSFNVYDQRWRRDTNVTQSPRSAFTLQHPYQIDGSGLRDGAVIGSDNWLLLSSQTGAITSDYNFALQLSIGSDGTSIADDSIVMVWYDDSPSAPDVLAGVTAFSQITASPIPEPSSALLLGLGAFGLITGRKRTS